MAEQEIDARETGGATYTIEASRRRMLTEGVGIVVSVIAFAIVYGLAARNAGFSLVETSAMSLLVFAGASQFAAVGLVAAGVPWAAIVPLTLLLNARHFLYGATLAPWLQERPRFLRAAMAFVLTDEAFAVVLAHVRRIARFDVPGYWLGAMFVWVPWQIGTVIGHVGGELIPDPNRLGLDVVFPATMGGLAVALIRTRPEMIASVVAAVVAVGIALVSQSAIGIVVGAVVGPVVGLVIESLRGASGSGSGARRVADEAGARAGGVERAEGSGA